MNLLILRSLTREEVRSIDVRAADEIGIPTAILMENAGRGAAICLRERIAAQHSSANILILCGPGNNGGDGAVLARHLDVWGFDTQVIWFADPAKLKGDAALQWQILERSGFKQSAWPDDPSTNTARLDALLTETGWIVDALLGTGLTRPVEGILRTAIEAINRAGKPVFALDLPSGLDSNRGIPLAVAVRATITATFVAPKIGFEAPGASDYTGEVIVVEIGAPRCILEAFRAS